jgi:hypothetical protein
MGKITSFLSSSLAFSSLLFLALKKKEEEKKDFLSLEQSGGEEGKKDTFPKQISRSCLRRRPLSPSPGSAFVFSLPAHVVAPFYYALSFLSGKRKEKGGKKRFAGATVVASTAVTTNDGEDGDVSDDSKNATRI